ncbi:MAG: cyclophilin-like fold protein [Bacteroides sp.]|nr:cyclophilin-like fold protein [Bacteroides sp.]MCM1388815.1 cyclophilin-like fold protein [Bacteroides sp.]
MKRLFISFLLLLPVMTFAGCSEDPNSPGTEIPDIPNNPGDNDDDNGSGSDTVTPGNGKILIAWFSRWGNTDYPADVDASTGASIIMDKGTRRGTTEVVARYIQTAVGGDLHLIETSNPYPTSFDDVRDQNHEEQADGTLPALKGRIENIDQYETVFIGYPVWAIDVPQAIKTFLSSYDLTGKTVVPFCTHDGYGAGRSYTTIRNHASGAAVLDGIALLAGDVPSSEKQVQDWLTQIGIEREEPQGKSVRITAGGRTFTGEWLDSPLANEIREMFPLKATLGRYGGREYYGSMPQRPTHTEEGQLRFENGDITYCPSNNTIAIFYAKADDPSMGQLTMRIIPIGKVTSDLTAFDELESRLEFTFDNAK